MSEKRHKKEILFIRGFNTDNIKTNDTYSHLKNILSQKNKVTYFNYSLNEEIQTVYKRLCSAINRENFTHLIGHSLGGGLLFKYISERKDVSKFKKIILLMPLIYKTQLNTFISKMPFSRNLVAPKISILPASKLYTLGNWLSDDYNLIPLRQVVDMHNKIMLEPGNIVPTLRQHRNVVLFYAREETFNTIPQNILDKVKNLEYVDGLHECFNGLNTSSKFYEIFLKYI
jgi:pimeloyl-ACP methyl ester carboxylesterase